MQCEYRIYEFNRRLATSRQQPHLDYSFDMPWWDNFISEFFDDDATLTIKIFEDRLNFYSEFILLSKFHLSVHYLSHWSCSYTTLFSYNIR